MYAYCQNNPVMMVDPDGEFAISIFVGSIIVGAIIGGALGGYTATQNGAELCSQSFWIGVGTGALIGGGVGAVAGMTLAGGGTCYLNGASTGFMTGALFGGIGGAVNRATTLAKWDPGTFGSKFDSLSYHYGKHGLNSGSSWWGNGMVNYTKDAINFSTRNASLLKYTYNYKFGNASWNFTYTASQGGIFTTTGKILTFWYF